MDEAILMLRECAVKLKSAVQTITGLRRTITNLRQERDDWKRSINLYSDEVAVLSAEIQVLTAKSVYLESRLMWNAGEVDRLQAELANADGTLVEVNAAWKFAAEAAAALTALDQATPEPARFANVLLDAEHADYLLDVLRTAVLHGIGPRQYDFQKGQGLIFAVMRVRDRLGTTSAGWAT